MHHELAVRSNVSLIFSQMFLHPEIHDQQWSCSSSIFFKSSQRKFMEIILVCVYEMERCSLIRFNSLAARLLNRTDWSESFLFGNKNCEQHNNCKPNQLSRLSFVEQTCRCCTTSVQQRSQLQESRLCPSSPSLLNLSLFILFCIITFSSFLSPQLCPSL